MTLVLKKKDNLPWVGRFQIKDPSSLTKTNEKYSKEPTSALINKSTTPISKVILKFVELVLWKIRYS